MTRSSWIVGVGLLMGLILVAVYQGGPLAWHVLGFSLVVALLCAFLTAGPLGLIRITRELPPGPYVAGEPLTVTLRLHTRRRWLWPYLTVTDQIPQDLAQATPRFLLTGLLHASTNLTYQLVAPPRGVYEWDAVTLTTGDPFGILRRQVTIPCATELVIWPQTVSLAGWHPDRLRWLGDQKADTVVRRETLEVRSIREYLYGDRLAHIHWKASAHTGDFKVKQFERSTEPPLCVVLDQSRRFSPDEWELAVSVAASLAVYAARRSSSIQLVRMDAPLSLSRATGTALGLGELMRDLSLATHGSDQPGTLLNHHGDALLLTITSAEGTKSFTASADRVVVVGVDGLKYLHDLPGYLSHASMRGRARP